MGRPSRALPRRGGKQKQIEKGDVKPMGIREELRERRLIFDGGMGSLLQARGLAAGEAPELWNLLHPEQIAQVHRQYREAGADVLTANTFGANRLKLAGTPYQAAEIIAAGVRLAKEAGGAYTALDMGPTGKLLAPYGELELEEAIAAFAEMAAAGEAAGADFALIETMGDLMEVKAAMLAIRESTRLPIVVTMTFDGQGKLLMGADIETAVTTVQALGADALGMNCGLGPHQFTELLPRLLACSSVPVLLSPNAGLPVSVNGETMYTVGPGEFAEAMAEMARMGAHALGGCCGTTPEHIAALKAACRDIPFVPPERKRETKVCSGRATVRFGERALVIGDRLNPTGKPKLKKALREGERDYLLREALAQEEAGADILDVNVGLPGIDEPGVMEQAVKRLQAVTALPLQIDTSDGKAMEKALRCYNGRPLLNSVCGKEESLETVLPLAKKYGAAVVALTLDEKGIPATAQGRLDIARKILERAREYGLEEEDIVVDPLTMAVSTGTDNALVTLEALKRIREELGVHTVLGVSNISFGLPRRDIINAAFFTLALGAGLSAGIINPGSEGMRDALAASHVLGGKDESCGSYLARYGGEGTGKAAQAPADRAAASLRESIVAGLKDQSRDLAAALAEAKAPLDIIDGELVPALDEVGKGFEKGKVFLPQLLMSAEAAKAAFGALRERMERDGQAQEKRGRIVLATVKGDVHDIGKNIVRALLENYGYEVVDLGKDVAPEQVLEAAKEGKTRLVGLSALMTTTVAAMEETIALLHRELPGIRVMVGGAVLTQDYAEQIGADYYAKDAMRSVEIAGEVYPKE